MCEQLGRLCRARRGWCFSCNALSSSGLCCCKGLLIDAGGVLGDSYFVTLLHVTCYIKRYAIREKGEKKLEGVSKLPI